MSVFLKKSLISFMVISMIFLTVSCGETKQVQCQKIGQVIKLVVNDTKNITNNGKKTDSDTLQKIATRLDQASKQMSELKLGDANLKQSQTGFIQWYQDNSQATKQLIEARKKKNNEAFENALKSLKKVNQPEADLVKNLNNYCGAK
jgi:hypothetical protein